MMGQENKVFRHETAFLQIGTNFCPINPLVVGYIVLTPRIVLESIVHCSKDNILYLELF